VALSLNMKSDHVPESRFAVSVEESRIVDGVNFQDPG